MKLLRYGPAGRERPGMLDADGNIRDLTAHIPDITSSVLSPDNLSRLAAIDPASLPLIYGEPRMGPIIADVPKFIGVGLNYSDHAAETGQKIPSEPVLFAKATSCIIGASDAVMLAPDAEKLDWEVELGLVIGTKARHVNEAQAMDHIAGYCIVNDLTERHIQLDPMRDRMRAKSFDTLGPIGPWLVTRDEIADVTDLAMTCDVNGVRRQTGNTSTMIFKPAFLISYISRCMPLMPGDIIATGTPPGVGMGLNPPQFLKAGDVMTLRVEGLGEQRQRVIPFAP